MSKWDRSSAYSTARPVRAVDRRCEIDGVGGLDARRMARHGRDELVAVERVEVDLADRRDRRRPRNIAEQRDLAEVVAADQALRTGFPSTVTSSSPESTT